MDDSFDRCTWPEIFKPISIHDNKFYEINEALLLAPGIVIHVKNKGYKDLDSLLERHGETIQIFFLALNVGYQFLTKRTRIILFGSVNERFCQLKV